MKSKNVYFKGRNYDLNIIGENIVLESPEKDIVFENGLFFIRQEAIGKVGYYYEEGDDYSSSVEYDEDEVENYIETAIIPYIIENKDNCIEFIH